MALLGHGGRSSVETRSCANTRPSTCASGRYSDSTIREASAISSKRARATSTGIRLPVLPGLPAGFTGNRLFQMRDEIARAVPRIQLFGQDAVPTGAYRVGRARQTA